MNDLLDLVRIDFESKSISSDILLSGAKLLDSNSKSSPAFNDPNYFSFYYRLGFHINPKSVIQYGSKLGLVGASFLKGSNATEKWVVVGESNFQKKIVESNLKLNKTIYVEFCDEGSLLNKDDLYDMAMVSEFNENFGKIDLMWSKLKINGLLVVDYIHEGAVNNIFNNLCNIKNREPKIFKTRYGVGIIQR